MQATNWAYNVAPKDGTVILATYNALLDDPLYGSQAARFDPLKFESVGSIAKQQTICATWHTSEIKTIEQARDREVTVSATGSSGDRATMPRILNALLGHQVQGHQRLRHHRVHAGGRAWRGRRHVRRVVVDAEGF